MRVHLVHGIHTPTGDPLVPQLLPYLRDAGFDIRFPDYGWIGGLETKVVNPLMASVMLPYIEAGDIFVGHSNGCAIGYDLMNRGVAFAGAAFINPALDPHIVRPSSVRWIDVYWNQGDQITRAAQLAKKLGWVDAVWGEAGHAGYQGTDPAIHNINCGIEPGMPVVSGHSDIFTPGKIKVWGPYIVKRIVDALSPA